MNDTTTGYKRTRLACYVAYFTMSSVFSLPPLLFVTFHEMYHVSYTLLGTLILTNFCTQMAIDLVFTVFSRHFNVRKVVRIMPVITSLGLMIYALVPVFLPDHTYIGLLVGTIIFSVSAGLSEVLLSPVIAALPSDNPQRDMSMLHSLYAFGVFTIVTVSTLFLKLFGSGNWMLLTLFLALLPVAASVMFILSPIPDIQQQESPADLEGTKRRALVLAIFAGCIFFGSCAENAMSNWISGYMENALNIDKSIGDILGMAMFAILLGSARIAYAKFGKNIGRVLLIGMIGSSVCYLAAGLSTSVLLSFSACILTGMFTAMLWPGTLIMMEDKLPGTGVAAFALMAASGDLGASVAPQLMGIVIDRVSATDFAAELGAAANLSAEQIGMKAGMLVNSLFPVLGTILVAFMIRYFKKQGQKPACEKAQTVK